MKSNSKNIELKDKLHFNKIASNYSKKDILSVSSIPRKSIIKTAMEPAMKKLGKIETLLEIGCGIGAPAKYLKGYYKNYIGVDQSEVMIKIAKEYNSENGDTIFIAENVKDLNIKNNSIDLILLSGALHHMTDIDIVIKDLKKHLKPWGGILAIEPQSFNPLIQIMRKIRKLIDKNYSKDQTFFSEKELKQLFIKNELKINDITYLGYFSSPFAQVIFKPQFLFTPISRISTSLDRFLSKSLPWPFKKLSFNISIFGIKEK